MNQANFGEKNTDNVDMDITSAKEAFVDDDKTATSRKQEHIALAFQSRIPQSELDNRFYYEPLLSAHPGQHEKKQIPFLGKNLSAPIWISSMTGGTAWAKTINHNLARAAKDFGFGMGLGSCRALLTDDEFFQDFNVRPIIGDDLPLYANLGIAQLEKLLSSNQLHLMDAMLEKLRADGLIIHVNPMQEWLQPEGDRFSFSSLETIVRLIDLRPSLNLIVKEVGQGMGYQSLKALMQLPLKAIDFAAAGGTSFALLELLRSDEELLQTYLPFTTIGHNAEQMVDFIHKIMKEDGVSILCKEFIISGGIQSFLDGYYLVNKLKAPAVYGQASAFLKHARGSYDKLHHYIALQVNGYKMAEAFLKLKDA